MPKLIPRKVEAEQAMLSEAGDDELSVGCDGGRCVTILAMRFAAKEAVSKALGTGIGKELSWLDMEVIKNEQGAPALKLSPAAQTRFLNPQVLISLSHCKDHATAFAIALTPG